MKKLSVIMGVHNIEHLWVFEKSIQSVLNQSYDDFEFIICDDGSTDRTYEILCAYEKRDARVILLKNKTNRGLAYSLNRCMQKAQGEYLARHDADDISHQKRFEIQMNYMKQHPNISFSGTNAALFDRSGVWGRRILPLRPQKKDFLFTDPFVHGTLIFKKQDLLELGGYRIRKETRRAEDYDLLMRMYAHGKYGENLQECLYFFLEDAAAYSRRKYRFRFDEASVRWKGFWALGLMPKALPYVIKPLFVGLLPGSVLKRLKNGRSIQIQESKEFEKFVK